MIARRILSVVLTGSIFLFTTFQTGGLPALAQTAANANDQALDKLLGPIALYPDPLLAQVLACTSSPEQVKEVSAWLMMQDKALTGSKLQEAATAKGFDASFAAIVLFPDVLDTLVKNLPWTTEVGKAFLSDQKAVLASVQRLRMQAQSVGNLKTTSQQEVKVETQNGQQTIIVQPANPQIVYVPVYNTQTVYTQPAPPPEEKDDDSDAAVAALMGFMAGVAIGAVASDPYPYGWGAWGVGWHSSTVIVTGGAWRIPPGGRYGYTRPVPYGGYRAPTNINAPTRNVNNVNINVDNSRTNNINNSRNNTATNRPTTTPSTGTANRATQQPAATNRATTTPSTGTANRATQPSANTRATTTPSASATPSTRGNGSLSSGTSAAAAQSRAGTKSSGLSGYSSRSSAGAASSRGQRSAGGGRRR